jgi:hypothetical protein
MQFTNHLEATHPLNNVDCPWTFKYNLKESFELYLNNQKKESDSKDLFKYIIKGWNIGIQPLAPNPHAMSWYYGGNIKIKKTAKKEILGKERCIYKKSGDRKEYLKYKGGLITVSEYKKLMKSKK